MPLGGWCYDTRPPCVRSVTVSETRFGLEDFIIFGVANNSLE